MTDGRADGTYVWDDGISYDYRAGKRSCVTISATAGSEGRCTIDMRHVSDGFGRLVPAFTLIGVWDSVELTVDGAAIGTALTSGSRRIAGRDHVVTVVGTHNR